MFDLMLQFFKKYRKKERGLKSKHESISNTPVISGILPVLSVDKLLEGHSRRIINLKELAGLSEQNFEKYYKSAIVNFVRLVQLLPASEVHHHANSGGMLEHTLDVCIFALKIRRSYVLTTSNNAEDVSVEQDLWSYAIFLAALCHDLAKPVVDQKIEIYDQEHKVHHWNPWTHFIDEQGLWYTCQFVKKRHYKLHEKASPLLCHKVVPADGMQWLNSNQSIFIQWLSAVSGDNEDALSIGEIINLADCKSVANNLGASSSQLSVSQSKVKPLHEKMLTALRHLLLEGELPLNRNGAAGWIKDNQCWLVSKRSIDAIREQLTKEGHTGLPTKNGRMYDILQEHGILTPIDNKAIWKIKVSGEGWSNELTVINIPVSKIWTKQENRPDEFEGIIQNLEGKGANNEDKEQSLDSKIKFVEIKSVNINSENDNSNTQQPELTEQLTNTSNSENKRDNIESNTTAKNIDNETPENLLSFLPTPSDQIEVVDNKKVKQQNLAIKNTEKNSFENKSMVLNKQKKPVEKYSQPEQTKQDYSQLFFDWLETGIHAGQIKINTAEARVHVVNDGFIIVTPGIFQDFSKYYQQIDWKAIQKNVFKQKLHTRDQNGLNFIKYEVKGNNRVTSINTLLFEDLSLIYKKENFPTANPHLSRLT